MKRILLISLPFLIFGSAVFAGKKPLTKTVLHPDIILRDAFRAQVQGQDARAIRFYDAYFASGGKESAHVRSSFARVLSQAGLHDRAVHQIKRAVALKPRSPDHLIIYSDVLQKAGKSADALRILEGAVQKYENDVQIEFYLAEIYFDLTRYRDAKLHYKQVLFNLDKAGTRGAAFRNIALWRLANIYLREKDLDVSRLYFVRFVRHNPERLHARFVLGYFLYFQRGDFERAKRELELIAAQNPQNVRRQKVDLRLVYSALGEIYYLYEDHRAERFLKRIAPKQRNHLDRALILSMKGKNRKAFEYLISFLKGDPADFIGRVALIRILEQMKQEELLAKELMKVSALAGKIGQYRLGIAMSRQALELKAKNPKLPISVSLLNQQIAGHYESLDQPLRTVLYLRKTIESGDREKRWEGTSLRDALMLGLARLLSNSRVKRYQDAIATCDVLIKNRPSYGRAYLVRGQVRLKMKDNERAARDFTRAIELDKDQFIYYFFRAVAYHEQKDFERTVIDLKKVLALKGDFAEASNFLGYIYAERGVKIEEARKLIHKAVNISPTNGSYQDSLGLVYYRMKRWHEARYHLQLAALLLEEEKHEDPVVYDHLGDVYERLKLPRKALAAYRRALTLLAKKKRKNKRLTGDDVELEKNVKRKIESLKARVSG